MTLRNQPAFVSALDVSVHVPTVGEVKVDIAYGGMWYAVVDAGALGLELVPENGKEIVRLGETIKVCVFGGVRANAVWVWVRACVCACVRAGGECVGEVKVNFAYGGMWYAVVDAGAVGLDLVPENGKEIVRLGEKIKVCVRSPMLALCVCVCVCVCV